MVFYCILIIFLTNVFCFISCRFVTNKPNWLNSTVTNLFVNKIILIFCFILLAICKCFVEINFGSNLPSTSSYASVPVYVTLDLCCLLWAW